jgi:hypothetical protein
LHGRSSPAVACRHRERASSGTVSLRNNILPMREPERLVCRLTCCHGVTGPE